jgi:biopolymer transport protein ExbD
LLNEPLDGSPGNQHSAINNQQAITNQQSGITIGVFAMAMNLGGGTGIKSDINVTPLVDVMLVLLIIMMIVAPLLQKGVDVRLPVATNSTEKPETQDQTVLAVTADGRLWLNAVQVPEGQLRTRIDDIFENKTDRIVIIKADEDAEYRHVMDAMDELRASGIEDMGLITERKTAGLLGGGE